MPSPPVDKNDKQAITSIKLATSFEFNLNGSPQLPFTVLPSTADTSGLVSHSSAPSVLTFEMHTPILNGIGSAIVTLTDTSTGIIAETTVSVFLGIKSFSASFPSKIFIADTEIPVKIPYSPQNARKTNFTYHSGNEKIIAIENDKLVPKALGKCSVTVKNELGKEEAYPLEVLEYIPTKSLSLSVQKIILSVHSPEQELSPTILPENASIKTLFQDDNIADWQELSARAVNTSNNKEKVLILKNDSASAILQDFEKKPIKL